jgi:hypothetical protein
VLLSIINDNPLIPKGSVISHKSNAQWDDSWARFSQGLLSRDIVAGKHDFFRNWVRKFIGFVKPRKWDQALRDDVATMIFTHVLNKPGVAVRSPLD